MDERIYDLAVIGGGINGCGIARDAAGRGLRVCLCEKGDLAQATSSASTKLFHGGLRYLEHYEFSLVRKALIERETLLKNMPHISWPLRFVLPHHQGLRPRWMLRIGLFLYDHLGGRRILKGTSSLDLTSSPEGRCLRDEFTFAFEYSDCWVDDSRLVVLNAKDAAQRGAAIRTRTELKRASRTGDCWNLELENKITGQTYTIQARALVNATGPYINDVVTQSLGQNKPDKPIRLVRGSHIVIRQKYNHDKAYIFQNRDNRIFFAIPYEGEFTLIGTTDVEETGHLDRVECSSEEEDYLRKSASDYFKIPIKTEDIVWRYAGVRPLFDEGEGKSASSASRDYFLDLKTASGQPALLNVYGGKITTYRKLAEHALLKLSPLFRDMKGNWTHDKPLPGGNFAVDGVSELETSLQKRYPFLKESWIKRLVRAYGSECFDMLGDCATLDDLGQQFGHGLSEKEVRWLMREEFACNVDDILWRRSKLGLKLEPDRIDRLKHYLDEQPEIVS